MQDRIGILVENHLGLPTLVEDGPADDVDALASGPFPRERFGLRCVRRLLAMVAFVHPGHHLAVGLGVVFAASELSVSVVPLFLEALDEIGAAYLRFPLALWPGDRCRVGRCLMDQGAGGAVESQTASPSRSKPATIAACAPQPSADRRRSNSCSPASVSASSARLKPKATLRAPNGTSRGSALSMTSMEVR